MTKSSLWLQWFLFPFFDLVFAFVLLLLYLENMTCNNTEGVKGWCPSLFQCLWASQAFVLETSKVAPVPQFLQRCFCSCAVFCSTAMDLGHALKLNYTVYRAAVFWLLSSLRSGYVSAATEVTSTWCVILVPCQKNQS